MPTPPGHLTRAQAAIRLGLSQQWFDELVRRRELSKRVTPNRRVYFLETEVDALAAKRAELIEQPGEQ